MCLAIACSHSCINLAKHDSVLPQVTPHTINMATKLYFELGGKPMTGQGPRIGLSPFGGTENGGLLGIPLTTFEIRYSAKHNGLALYILRIVKGIWNKKLVKTGYGFYKMIDLNRAIKDRVEANFTISELVTVQSHLQSLDQFLKQYKSFTALPTPDNRPAGVDADAWRVCCVA